MSDRATTERRYFWERFRPDDRNAGADLAALRKGLGREAGSVPEMWRFHKVFVPDDIAVRGDVSWGFVAEHHALTLFAVHQQSQRRSMHRPGVRIGSALRELRRSDKTSSDAVDRRVNAAATATSVTELVAHLRGLVTQLRGFAQPLDYTGLMSDIRDWHDPDRRNRVRRRWGIDYYAWAREPGDKTTETVEA